MSRPVVSSGLRSKRALIVTPFASQPADAGHRRRVLQTTRMLRDDGYEITFLLYAFELPWYWRFDRQAFHAMSEEWGDVQIVYPHPRVGSAPQNGVLHGLDEWWDPALGEYLERMFRVRSFDAMIVHNVWLSKAFSYAPPSTIKMLETHDIFWKRGELYRRLGKPVDFFTPSMPDEVHGLNRADVVITVTDEELELVRPHLTKPAFTIPTYEPIGRARSGPRLQYLNTKKVTFGMLGSPHVFNIMGLQRLLDALEPRIARTFAPVEIVVGGGVGAAVTSRLPVRRLGYVEDEADFFEQVDFVIAPLFEGTGFKVKVADAVIFRKPLLSATHAAEGTFLSPLCCSPTAEDMAEQMIRISVERPPLGDFVQLSLDASRKMAAKADIGHALMRDAIQVGQASLLLDLSALDADDDLPVLLSYGSYLRPISRFFRVYVAPPKGLEKMLNDGAMPGVEIVDAETMDKLAGAVSRVIRVSPIDNPARDASWLRDARWTASSRVEGGELSFSEILPAPMIHPDVTWMPLCDLLRSRARRQLALRPQPRQIIFLDGSAGVSQQRLELALPGILMVDCNDRSAFATAVSWMLLRRGEALEIIWAAGADDPRRQFVFELSAVFNFRHWGGNTDGQACEGSFAQDAAQTLSYAFDLAVSEIAAAI